MFTGIIAEVGRIAGITRLDTGQLTVAITADKVLRGAAPGDSIAVNGVCLTITELLAPTFTADVMAETLRRTTLGVLAPGSPVNLEAAATPTTALGGHIVQGHVDATGAVLAREPSGDFDEVTVSLPPAVARYVVAKGSVAVEGVSLTVAAVGEDWFRVALIPATLQHTTLGSLAEGDPVNLEVDVIAKYVERLLAGAR
jgi:riboflavin synthase